MLLCPYVSHFLGKESNIFIYKLMMCCSCQDKEEPRKCKVQGTLLAVPLHPGHHRQGKGRET